MMKEREMTKDFKDWLKKHEIKETNPFFGNGKVEKQRTSTEETNSDKEDGKKSEGHSPLLGQSRQSIKIP